MNLQSVCKNFVPSAIPMSERGCTFASAFEKHTEMNLLMRLFPLTPLGVLFGLLAVLGIVVFIVACWRNIKQDDNERNELDK